MKILKDKNLFKVISDSGNTYFVDPKEKTCTCPHFSFRAKANKQTCKHIDAVLNSEVCMQKDSEQIITEYIRERNSVDSVELIEKFGEEAIDSLINNGILFEESGKIRLI